MITQLVASLSSRARRSRLGFTMIELLVVISVIGVLAVAVLSTINPIEQINKGRDTRTRSDAAQLINAAERYYAIQELYPWNTTIGGASVPANQFGYVPGGTDTWMDELVDTDEVKQGFIDRLQTAAGDIIYLHKPTGSSATLYACFRPTSKAFQLEAQRACDNDTTKRFTITPTQGGAAVQTCPNLNADPPSANNMICLP